MNLNRKENNEVGTISFEIRIQTRFHKKINRSHENNWANFIYCRKTCRKKQIHTLTTVPNYLLTVGSLVIAVLGSWHKIASVRDYLVTILNFLGFIASQSKKKILRQWKLIHHESRSEELQQRIIACTVHWYCSSQWFVFTFSRPLETKLYFLIIDRTRF